MSCNYRKTLLQGYIDGELDVVRSLEVETHMQGCEECRSAHASALNLRAALADPEFLHEPSAAAVRRIAAALSRETRPRRVSLQQVSAYAVAAVVLLALPFFWFGRNSNPDDLMGPVIDSHIRSLQPGHLEDVISTDKHTVKPWFNGRLDYSPPVADLASKGYPLIGGRLDYMAGRPVSALIYRRAKHIINVFVWPDDRGATSLMNVGERQGYNVYHWRTHDMTWWASSDLNDQELSQFCHLLQSQ